MRAANYSAYDNKMVWIEVRKTFEELRPARVLRRLSELITTCMAELPGDIPQIDLDQRTRSISVNKVRFAHLGRDAGVVWTPAAQAALKVESRAWAESALESTR